MSANPHYTDGTILALDVGARRIGLARANRVARLATPFGVLENNASTLDRLKALCEAEHVKQLVVGLPRGLDGQETAQTMTVRAFGALLGKALDIPIHWQDEALTSVQAQAELEARGKAFARGDIDSLAAVYILEDYLSDHL